MTRLSLRSSRLAGAALVIAALSLTGVASASTPSSARTHACRPLTNKGRCYEPGEFCRHTDRGVKGIAGDGKRIVCRNNDGLRWEPY